MTSSRMFGHLGPPGFDGSRELLAHFRPSLWVFGHHHRWFHTTLDGTCFHCLPEAWRGYALLYDDDPDGSRLECVASEVPHAPDWWWRLWRRGPAESENTNDLG
jgi:hypothetical protein